MEKNEKEQPVTREEVDYVTGKTIDVLKTHSNEIEMLRKQVDLLFSNACENNATESNKDTGRSDSERIDVLFLKHCVERINGLIDKLEKNNGGINNRIDARLRKLELGQSSFAASLKYCSIAQRILIIGFVAYAIISSTPLIKWLISLLTGQQ